MAILTREEKIEALDEEIEDLRMRLGHALLARRAFSGVAEKDNLKATVVNKRTFITPELREKYNAELIAVLEAFGEATVQQLKERGDFGELSRTSIYKIAMNHPNVTRNERGRTFFFSLNR